MSFFTKSSSLFCSVQLQSWVLLEFQSLELLCNGYWLQKSPFRWQKGRDEVEITAYQ